MLQMRLAVVLLLLVAVHGAQPPLTCFANGKCYKLADYIMDSNTRSQIVSRCSQNAGSPHECDYLTADPLDLNTVLAAPTVNTYTPDIMAVRSYTGIGKSTGPLESDVQPALRKLTKGINVTSDYLNAILLTASGINVLAQNATLNAYIESDDNYVFRGEPVYKGAPCVPDTSAPTFVFSHDERTIFQFDSWSRAFRVAGGWSTMETNWGGKPVPGRVLMLHRRKLGKGGAYLAPVGIPWQYEYTTVPGLRVKSLGCEQVPFTTGTTRTSVAVEYLYDITEEDPATPAEESVMLSAMRAAVAQNEASCFPSLCKCQGSPNQDPLVPLPNTPCANGQLAFAAKGTELPNAHDSSKHTGTILAVVAVAVAAAVVAVAVLARRRRARHAEALELSGSY